MTNTVIITIKTPAELLLYLVCMWKWYFTAWCSKRHHGFSSNNISKINKYSKVKYRRSHFVSPLLEVSSWESMSRMICLWRQSRLGKDEVLHHQGPSSVAFSSLLPHASSNGWIINHFHVCKFLKSPHRFFLFKWVKSILNTAELCTLHAMFQILFYLTHFLSPLKKKNFFFRCINADQVNLWIGTMKR